VRSVLQVIVTAYIVSSLLILVSLVTEAKPSSETSVLTRATRRNNPEDTILLSLKTCNFIRVLLENHLGDVRSMRGYEELCLLGCYAVWFLQEPTFRRNLAPPSSG
jgi:hypothetical protein